MAKQIIADLMGYQHLSRYREQDEATLAYALEAVVAMRRREPRS
jgi:hypothetical protein